jgi:hypothetical protein
MLVVVLPVVPGGEPGVDMHVILGEKNVPLEIQLIEEDEPSDQVPLKINGAVPVLVSSVPAEGMPPVIFLPVRGYQPEALADFPGLGLRPVSQSTIPQSSERRSPPAPEKGRHIPALGLLTIIIGMHPGNVTISIYRSGSSANVVQ